MEIVAIKSYPKEGSGKVAARKVRRSGLVPASMYKSGGGPATHFCVSIEDFRPLVYTPDFKLAEVTIDGTTHKCILKDVQFHPVSDMAVHLDFLELVPGVKFKASVPVRFFGSAPGVKAGGKFITSLRNIKIMATPETVVASVQADISGMELGSTIRVRDIQIQDGVDVLNTASVPVASIEIPRALRGK